MIQIADTFERSYDHWNEAGRPNEGFPSASLRPSMSGATSAERSCPEAVMPALGHKKTLGTLRSNVRSRG